MTKHLIALACLATLFSGCIGDDKKEENWTSFIYPDKENTKRNVKSPITFKSLQECKDETIKQMIKLNIKDSGTFKCGLNCGFHDGMKVEICERMLNPVEK